MDCPGHDILMSIMLDDAAVMDAALHLIARHETCPQLQIFEHLARSKSRSWKTSYKVDLIVEAQAFEHQKSIAAFVKGGHGGRVVTHGSDMQPKYDIDTVNEYIIKHIPILVCDFASDPSFIVVCSFDIDKPSADIDELKGGSILTDILRVRARIQASSGDSTKRHSGLEPCKLVSSKIVSLYAENNHLQFAVPGGLIGKINPTLCRADRLVDQVLGAIVTFQKSILVSILDRYPFAF
ncbi:hypothetical protein EV424DRAFT_1646464 [Suillus variegatus]|nr:hypothetical protein EV424DRAFT_1646464 [Suillus variegatus]